MLRQLQSDHLDATENQEAPFFDILICCDFAKVIINLRSSRKVFFRSCRKSIGLRKPKHPPRWLLRSSDLDLEHRFNSSSMNLLHFMSADFKCLSHLLPFISFQFFWMKFRFYLITLEMFFFLDLDFSNERIEIKYSCISRSSFN